MVPKSLTVGLVVFAIAFAGCTEATCSDKVTSWDTTYVHPNETPPGISNVHFTQNGELLASNPMLGTVSILQDCPACSLDVMENQGAPVRAIDVDLNQDGVQDLLVSDIGVLFPSDETKGRLLWHKGTPNGYETTSLLDGEGRTVCAEPGDIDGDGDLDLVVCIFGHVDVGSLVLLEQVGGQFWRTELADGPGWTEAHIVDMNGDGHQDVLTLTSQLREEIVILWGPELTPETIWRAGRTNFGLSSVTPMDLDSDGRLDVVFTNGDMLDGDFDRNVGLAQQHGVHVLWHDDWLHERLYGLGGAYTAKALDADQDGDLDLLASALVMPDANGGKPSPSLVYLENQELEFASTFVAAPDFLITMDIKDPFTAPVVAVGAHNPMSSEPATPLALLQPVVTCF